MNASYLKKLSARDIGRIRQNAESLFSHLRTLEIDEWVDLFCDLIHNPSQVTILFNFRFLREAQESFVACMTTTSEQMKTVMAKAADKLIKQARSKNTRRAQKTLEGTLFVGSGLGLPMNLTLLVGMLDSPEVSPQIRLQAGAALLALDASPSLHAVWQKIEIGDAYFLAPVLASALSRINPLKSLQIVADLPADVISPASLEYPIREAFANLSLRMVNEVAALLQDDFPYRHVIENIIQEPSFVSWQSALARADSGMISALRHHTRVAYFGTLDLESLRMEFPEPMPFL
jgi:hypothetical protein